MNSKKIKNKYKAFTLAEVLVALMILGILTAILVPSLYNLMPKDSVVMLKKAYQITSKALELMMNDEELYIDEDKGFASDTGENFCKNFAGYFNKVTDNTSSNCKGTTTKPSPFMITSDGMKWYYIFNSSYTDTDAKYGYKIIVDVNGNKAPNCQLSTQNLCSTFAVGDSHTCVTATGNGCDNPDTFIISINRKGKIAVAQPAWVPSGTLEAYDSNVLKNATKLSW